LRLHHGISHRENEISYGVINERKVRPGETRRETNAESIIEIKQPRRNMGGSKYANEMQQKIANRLCQAMKYESY
jgi:phosphoribosylformylglycinamidine (FGAM) synthase-like enzyme